MKNLKLIIRLTVLFLIQSLFVLAQEVPKPAQDGCVFGDCLNGRGKFVNSYLTYEGNWKNGVKEGQGMLKTYIGEVYTGEFKNNKYNGKGKFDSGTSVYEGDFVNGKKEGKGTEKSAVSIYVGDFKNGKRDGKGKLTKMMSNTVQEGTFKEGKFIE